jgi:hypothetical protein
MKTLLQILCIVSFLLFNIGIHNILYAQRPELLDSLKIVSRPQLFASACDITSTSAVVRIIVPTPSQDFFRTVLGGSMAWVSNIRYVVSDSNRFRKSAFIDYYIACENYIEAWKNKIAPDDTIRVLHFTIDGLKPSTTYYVSGQNFFAISGGGIDVVTIFSSTGTISFTTPALTSLNTPVVSPAASVSTSGFTLQWTQPTPKPHFYRIELATDSLFLQLLETTSWRMPNDSSVVISGLQANTRYFYRIRAVRAGQPDILSAVGSERTLASAAMSSFNAAGTSLFDVASSFRGLNYDDFCSSLSPHYAYTVGASLSFAQMDSILAVLLRTGIPVMQAWMQDNSTCDGKDSGTSELRIKLLVDNSRVQSYGFSRRYNDWASSCLCRKYRVYTNFTPTSVHQTATIDFTGNVSPNPATEAANISLSLPVSSTVRIALYDALGHEIRGVAENLYAAGVHEFSVSVEGLPSGMYFLRCNVGAQVLVRHLSVVR